MYKLMCIVLSAVVIALCRAIRVVCLHDVSMNAIGVEGAGKGEEEPSHHHVAPRISLPHEPSQQPSHHHGAYGAFLPHKRPQQQHVVVSSQFATESF
jgi:hypothetical protein